MYVNLARNRVPVRVLPIEALRAARAARSPLSSSEAPLKLSTLYDVLCAAHLSTYVRSPFDSRGGIILVAFGESLKTSVLEVLEYYHPHALVQTDLTVQTLGKLRERIAQGIVRSLVLTDFQKLYERNPAVAANVEGSIRAMVAEGFTSLSFEEQQINRFKARAVVFGAITPAVMGKRFTEWQDSGFARRFLFPVYRLANPEVLMSAIVQQRLIDLGRGVIPPPRNKVIPYAVTTRESEHLHHLLRYQYGQAIPLQLLQKILSVLKWHYAESGSAAVRREAMETIEDFAVSLSREGAELELPDLPPAARPVPHRPKGAKDAIA